MDTNSLSNPSTGIETKAADAALVGENKNRPNATRARECLADAMDTMRAPADLIAGAEAVLEEELNEGWHFGGVIGLRAKRSKITSGVRLFCWREKAGRIVSEEIEEWQEMPSLAGGAQ